MHARLRTRSTHEIASSPWGIGIETIDRGYVDFAAVAPHLAELGAKQARLQAGWARCEPVPGAPYAWAWLDACVDGCLAAGVTPWLQVSYGNPAYPGGGGIGLAQGIPTSAEALAAWDRWVASLASRYSGRVRRWEIWNEADHKEAVCPEGYLDLFVRTASRIRAVDPRARIAGLALAGKIEFAEAFLRLLASADRFDLLDEVTFHGYPENPDEGYAMPERLLAILDSLGARRVALAQGETGAPSARLEGIKLALNTTDWSERRQAAWNLRRLLGHHARGLPMSLFQLADMRYEKRDGALYEGINPKGLLAIDPATKQVRHRKLAYRAAAHVFSLWDDRFPLRALPPLAAEAPFRVAAYAWQATADTAPSLVAWWRSDLTPALETPAPVPISLAAPALRDPVLVDLLSGEITAAPTDLSRLPCLDHPLALAERASLLFTGAAPA